jgi:hypothetical protein
MNSKSMFKKILLSAVICLSLSFLTVFTVKKIYSFVDLRDDRGFDYDSIIARGYEWTGPKAGEQIDLNHLKDKNNAPLFQKSTKRFILLSVVDPECGASLVASDQMEYIQRNVEKNDVGYVVISFSQKLTPEGLIEYVRSLGLSTDTYLWTGRYEDLLPAIKEMIMPTHILIDSQGNVIKSFSGTDREAHVRERMANQIVKEVTERNNARETN